MLGQGILRSGKWLRACGSGRRSKQSRDQRLRTSNDTSLCDYVTISRIHRLGVRMEKLRGMVFQ